ncbi:MAG: HEAT repeat domain-containing protein [Acidobacteriota bacterium]
MRLLTRCPSTFVLFVGFFLCGQALTANRPVVPGRHTGNETQEYYLKKAGVSTDLASLIRAARSNNDLLVRAFAVELLGARNERSAIPTLETVYKLDQESLIRETAALALASMEVPGAVEKLEECLRKNVRGLDRQVYLAIRLVEFGDHVGYQYVVAAARSTDPYLRDLAAMGLVRFGTSGWTGTDPETLPVTLLGKLLNDPVARVRRAVIVNISGVSRGFDPTEFVAKIATLAKADPDPDVRHAAEIFLFFHKPARPEEATP